MPAFEMRWRDTLFASWPVDPDRLAPRLPDGLAVDTFGGDAYLSVVPFAIEDIRPRGLPARLGLSTPELNLRTYVTAGDAAGVYFFSLDADDLLGVAGARLFNHLPYYYADIDYERGERVRFGSRRRTPGARAARFEATYGPADSGDEPAAADPGTLAGFLVERYRYFAEGPDGDLRYAAIEHDPWRLRAAAWDCRRNTLFRANGFEAPAGEAHLLLGEDLAVTAAAAERW